RAGLGLRMDARAFLDGTRRFAKQITTDPGGSALTSGLGGRPSRLDGSTSAHMRALIRIIRRGEPPSPPLRARGRAVSKTARVVSGPILRFRLEVGGVVTLAQLRRRITGGLVDHSAALHSGRSEEHTSELQSR